ncbi:unnamed protein product [Lathyrus sativus]|nr:unnamed protein product [Lathyrus sativus]
MFSSFWRSIDRFSIQHFKCVISELQKIKVVNKHNREYVVDLLQCIVEIVTYGDRQDPLIFEYFMEHQVLADFVRILKTSENSKIEAPLLQYLSIMIQNMDSEQAIYYCFSNGYINNIISHPYEFDGGDLASYYVSFLRAISGKINGDTLCLLVKVHGDAVVSFPLYTEALRFAHHEEKMIQTAIRSLVLNIYNVSDDMVYQFILTPPNSEYFSDLVHRLRDLCFCLDTILYDKGEMETQKRKNGLILQSDKIVDELYYFKDILSVGKPRLTKLVTENLLNGLVFPALFSLLVSKDNDESGLSAVTSLYIVSRLLQIVGGRSIVNNVACVILYHFLNLNATVQSEGNAIDDHDNVKPFAKCLSEIERTICYVPELNGAESITGNHLGAHWEDFMSGFRTDEICPKRRGLLEFVFSEDCRLLLASIFLLLILAESKDLDCFLSPIIGLYGTGDVMMQTNSSSTSKPADGSIFTRFMPEIVNALLKVLGFQQSLSAMMLWHVGWCLLKLLNFNREGLNSDNLLLFTTLYDQSRARFLKELDGIWFDHIPDALRTEWESCIRALEQSSHYKNPLFILELDFHQQSISGETSSYFAWQRMDDAMKAFILHFQLNTFIFKSVLADKPLWNTIATSTNDSGANQSDVSSTSFGSNVSLESGIPCQIAFSNSEIRDVYVIPVAYGMVGKLLLAEKHPFRSRHGVVIAIAPLAGLCPKIDEDHPSWLLLQIRNFDPQFYTIKARDNNLSMTHHLADGRWTLGFLNEKACKEAQFAILNEVTKQRSAVEYMLAPLLQNDLGLAVGKGS